MKPLIIQSDFGYSDGAVCAMHGVAYGVNPDLAIHDLTHDIPPYDIWEGSCRLAQTIPYWPEGSVFVSVVDPGVGSSRLSVVVETATGHYIVTPDNGSITHIASHFGINHARIIDEEINRLPGSSHSYTFHGRDIYAYTGARLAAGVIDFSHVGPSIDHGSLITLPVVAPHISDHQVTGVIDTHDVRYGSLWTNIPRAMFEKLEAPYGDYVLTRIRSNSGDVYSAPLRLCRSFADVSVGEALIYVNSLDNMAIAINRGSFARAYRVGQGTSWSVEFTYPLPSTTTC